MEKKKILLALFVLICAVYVVFDDSDSTPASGQRTQTPTTAPVTYYVPQYVPNSYYVPSTSKTEVTCSVCKKGRRTCSSCHGTGFLQRTQYAPNFGFSSGNTSYKVDIICPTCNGTGEMSCIYCGGDGKL